MGYPHASEEALDLMRQCLAFNPNKRITAEQSLEHPYVAQFHNEEDEISCDKEIKIVIDDDHKYSFNDYRETLYDQVVQKKKEGKRKARAAKERKKSRDEGADADAVEKKKKKKRDGDGEDGEKRKKRKKKDADDEGDGEKKKSKKKKKSSEGDGEKKKKKKKTAERGGGVSRWQRGWWFH